MKIRKRINDKYIYEENNIEIATKYKDKYNNLIYQGDIIKVPNAEEPEHRGFTVCFTGHKFVLSNRYNHSVVDLDTIYTSSMEIIGNIYDGVKLTKEEKERNKVLLKAFIEGNLVRYREELKTMNEVRGLKTVELITDFNEVSHLLDEL